MLKIKKKIGKIIHSKQTMSQAIMLMTIIILLSKAMGFVRDMIVAYFFGTSETMDAFISSQTPLNFINGIVMGAIIAVFIPLFIGVRKSRGQQEAERFSSTIYYFAMLIMIFLVVITVGFAPEVMKLFFPGFSGAKLALSVKFLKWMSLAILLTATMNFINAILRSEKKFLAYPLMGLGFNAVIISALILTRRLGNISLVIAWTSGPLFMTLILGFAERRYLNPLKVRRHIPEALDLLKMISPILFSSAFGMLNTIVDRSFASTLSTGAISALMYARRVSGAVTGILGVPTQQASYPSIAANAADNDMSTLSSTLRRSMKLLAFLLIPISFALFPLSKGIIEIIFQRGNFTYESTLWTYPPLMAAGLSLFTGVYNIILVRVYYSFKDSKTPMIYGIIGIGINIFLNFLFIHPLKQTGLALSTSLSSFYFTIAMLISLRKKFGIWFFSTGHFVRVLIASSVMVAGMYPIMLFVKGRIRYAIATAIGLGIYFLMAKILKILPKHLWRYLKFKKIPSEETENTEH